jgi:hypothetical protein
MLCNVGSWQYCELSHKKHSTQQEQMAYKGDKHIADYVS